MGYETKVILRAVADIVRTSKNLDEAYERIAKLANAEGVVVDRDDTPEKYVLKKLREVEAVADRPETWLDEAEFWERAEKL